MSREWNTDKKRWERPTLRSESVQETLAQPACRIKPAKGSFPGKGNRRAPSGQPAFS